MLLIQEASFSVCMVAENVWEISVPSCYFCSETKPALKKNKAFKIIRAYCSCWEGRKVWLEDNEEGEPER